MNENTLSIVKGMTDAARELARINAMMFKAFVISGNTEQQAIDMVKHQGVSLKKIIMVA